MNNKNELLTAFIQQKKKYNKIKLITATTTTKYKSNQK